MIHSALESSFLCSFIHILGKSCILRAEWFSLQIEILLVMLFKTKIKAPQSNHPDQRKQCSQIFFGI